MGASSDIPRIMYGTAWKEAATEGLVSEALAAGFRAIDTANQRKHYYEEGVGRALRKAFDAGLDRDEVFIQTKYTFRDGQDHRLPYDPEAPIAEQVGQSFESSLLHLGVDRIDSLVLHGPASHPGLVEADHDAWRAMELLLDANRVRFVGVSNVDADQLEALLDFSRIRPRFVQNRCYAKRSWDARVRAICDREGLIYQGFSLLTANPQFLGHPVVSELAARHGVTNEQVVFRFCRHLGMLPLTGTTDPEHMRQDLAAIDLELDEADLQRLLSINP